MNAYLLKSGRVLIPKRAEGPGLIGDGYIEVAADSPEAKAWAKWTVPAPKEMDK